MNFKDLKIVFAGCARDCADFLPKTLNNIRYYASLFNEHYTIIVENGSKDKTREILNKNKKKNDNFLFCDHFNQLPYRGQRLERGRNLIIETIKKNKKLISCDLFIMLDLDDIGTYKINSDDIKYSIKFLYSKEDIAGVFANQEGLYYDIWTLRDDNYCKDDFWAEVFKFLIKNKNSSEQISKNLLDQAKVEVIDKKILSFKKNSPPILVKSAFGGFGIYKMKKVLKNKNKYQGIQNFDVYTKDNKKINVNYQKCEHVNFNEGFADQNSKLYILPHLINHKFSNFEFDAVSALNLLIK